MRALNWALFLVTFCSLCLSAAFADDERMCPREGELDAFPREVLDAVFWEAGGIDHLAMHSEDPKEYTFRILSMDDRDDDILDSTSIHLLTFAVEAPFVATVKERPSTVEQLTSFIEDPRFAAPPYSNTKAPADRLRIFFIRDGISDQAEIESIIDDLMRRDGSEEVDTITIDGCRITRLRKEWEIGSTKLLLPRGNSKKQDLECAVSALLFHYGISNADYITNVDKVSESDDGHFGRLEKHILLGLYSELPPFPEFQPGLTRCEFVSRFFN